MFSSGRSHRVRTCATEPRYRARALGSKHGAQTRAQSAHHPSGYSISSPSLSLLAHSVKMFREVSHSPSLHASLSYVLMTFSLSQLEISRIPVECLVEVTLSLSLSMASHIQGDSLRLIFTLLGPRCLGVSHPKGLKCSS